MVVLDQLNKIPTLDIFQVKPNVTRFVTYLLAREALTHVLTNATTIAWPRMAFLFLRQRLSKALMANNIVSTKHNFMLVQLRHNDHAWKFVQRTLLRGILHAKDPIFVVEQMIFFVFVIVARERAHVLRKNIMIDGLFCHQFFMASTNTSRFCT